MCFVEIVAGEDGGVWEAGFVENFAGFDAEVGEVAAVEADADHLMARFMKAFAGIDGVADAFERVVGVDEEDAVVGHGLGVGVEGFELGSRRT